MLKGERLKEARKSKNLSQEQLAEAISVSKGAISLYESEKRSPKLETIIDLMYVLGVSADFLLGTDIIVEIVEESTPTYRSLTKEEMLFINELRKDEYVYDTLIQNPKRGVEIIKTKL